MVSLLPSSVVDHGFIGGAMVSLLPSSVVDHGFIGGAMVTLLPLSVVDHGFRNIQCTQDKIIVFEFKEIIHIKTNSM
jgi:hypothetical protein